MAPALLKRAEALAKKQAHRAAAPPRQIGLPVLSLDGEQRDAAADPDGLSPLGALYRREATRLLARYPAADLSRVDWVIILSLVYAFQDVSAAELAQAMYEGSPRLYERKAGHVADYVQRTVAKAVQQRPPTPAPSTSVLNNRPASRPPTDDTGERA